MQKIIAIVFLLTSYSLTQAQDMKGMDMGKTATKQSQPVTYTCPMHPDIHASKPGNCPKCGMKLVKEKTAKGNGPKMQIAKDPAKKKDMDMGGMQMDNMDIKKDSTRKMGAAEMKGMENMAITAASIRNIKTIVNNTPPHTVRYDLFVADTMVNYSGKTKRAIAVNGQIPMPTLTFTEGDTAEIYVHNNLQEGTTLHWHGLFLPNKYDGVANLTQMPIPPHSTYLYRFPIIQHGTHFYHSHNGLQEQIGMYGAFILNKRKELDIPTIPVVISEWADMKPEQIQRRLKNASDWFAIQKGTTQSYAEAIRGRYFKTKLTNEWKRMNAMDVSDIYYDKFLLNGKNESTHPQFKAGDKVRLRVINAGSSDYFWLTYSGGKITVVASDGNDIVPIEVDRLIIAVSETYDVIVTIPENKSYEFLVTPEDRTKSTSLWLGSGQKVEATRLPKLKYFAGMKMMNNMMDMHGNMVEMEGMKMEDQKMDMNTVMYPEITGAENSKDTTKAVVMQGMDMKEKSKKGTPPMQMDKPKHSMEGMAMEGDNADIITLNYSMLRAPEKTILPQGPLKELKFDLTGNMSRYVWTLDNKTISESDKILIKKGENVRIILYNNSMMRHPMHLHGHDFRILNGQGDYAPLKNVLDMMPMERDTIEFAAHADGGDWFFHCHILYHMMSGMGRIFRYQNSPPNPALTDPVMANRMLNADDRMFHTMAKVGIESNGSDGNIMLSNTRWKASTMWHLGYTDMHGYESETMFGRYLGRMQWLYPYIGFDYHHKIEGGPKNIFGSEAKNWFGQTSNKNNRKTIVAGIAYTLPMLFIADARVDGDGKFRFQLGREDIVLTSRLRFNIMVNTDKEYATGLRYILTKYFSISSHYDSDMGLGVGVTLNY